MSDLTVTADKVTTTDYFQNTFLTGGDREKVKYINTDQVTSKRIMIITLSNRQECFDFKAKYEKLEFNGKNPRISVLLGND